jgi:hypothetical protein
VPARVKEGAAEKLLEYMLRLRDLMRLQAWDLEVNATDPAKDDAALDVTPNVRLHWATVRIGTFFDNGPQYVNNRDEKRRAVIHELVHLWQADLLYYIHEGDWKLPLAPDVARSIEERIDHELEIQAEMCARALAPFMPYGPEEWDDPSG